ncbi:tRNA dimethylallyltransferase, partial [Enterovirga sp.]|uniref:tRNA (adenosine(37)-N6)-dimethylallyltransferase n=1 Tax=Enterovirga sp. TaxID=2026350 RepID=UPI0026063448
AARLRPSDRQRVLRALEVLEATGQPLASLQGARRPGWLARRRWRGLFLSPARETLRERIDRRFVAMVEAGALDEVRRLGARGLDPALPVMRAHGVPALLGHLRGEMSLDEAVRRGQADTRAYAKRQVTWFRHQMPGWHAVPPEEAPEAARTLLAGAGPE